MCGPDEIWAARCCGSCKHYDRVWEGIEIFCKKHQGYGLNLTTVCPDHEYSEDEIESAGYVYFKKNYNKTES